MKKTISALLLSFPLSVLAADIKLEDMKGQYVSLDQNDKCLSKIVVDVMKNRMMVYDLASGRQELSREIYTETVKYSDTLVEGQIKDSVLIEKRFKVKKALGVVVDKKIISEIKVTLGKDKVSFEENGDLCNFGKDLPEITPQDPEKPGSLPEPTVEVGDITQRANTDYVSIKRYFQNEDELLDTRVANETLKKLLKIKSATDKYHFDVIDLITKKPDITPAQVALALKMPYFTAKELKAIRAKIKEVSEAKPVDYKLLDILTQNKYVAENYGRFFQIRLSNLISKIKEISVDEAKSIIKVLFPDVDQDISGLVISKIKNLSSDDKRSLIPVLEEAEAIETAARLAIDLINEERPNFSTDELLSNPLKLKDSTHAAVVGALGKNVSDASIDNFMKLAEVVKDGSALSQIAQTFLVKLQITSASDIMLIAKKLGSGYSDSDSYKDSFLIRAADQVNPLTKVDAMAMLKLTSFESNRSTLFNKLMSRLTEELSVDEFSGLVKTMNNGSYSSDQYRDSAILKYFTKVPETDTMANLKLIDILSNRDSRKTLAMGIWNRDSAKSMSKLLALAAKLENGSYSSDQYRNDALIEGVRSLKAISVAELKLFIDRLNTDSRVSQIQVNLSKLPTLSVEDTVLLISSLQNGSYSSDQYKDQGMLILLPKTVITTQVEITTLLTKTPNQDTKRAILNRAYKLTLPVNDISVLVSRENDSELKFEIIKSLAPKVAPISAQDIVELVKTIQNGSYSSDQYRTSTINYLMNIAKVSSINEIKLLMQQVGDSESRVAFYRKLKPQLGAVLAVNLISIADLIQNGSYSSDQYRDDLLHAEAKLITSVTNNEILALVDKVSSSEVDKTIILILASKVPSLSDLEVSSLLKKTQNGSYSSDQYRDEAALVLAPIVKSVSTAGITTVINTLSAHNVRKKVALTLLAKKQTVSKDDILVIAQSILNGSYSGEDYKTQFLAEAMALIK